MRRHASTRGGQGRHERGLKSAACAAATLDRAREGLSLRDLNDRTLLFTRRAHSDNTATIANDRTDERGDCEELWCRPHILRGVAGSPWSVPENGSVVVVSQNTRPQRMSPHELTMPRRERTERVRARRMLSRGERERVGADRGGASRSSGEEPPLAHHHDVVDLIHERDDGRVACFVVGSERLGQALTYELQRRANTDGSVRR